MKLIMLGLFVISVVALLFVWFKQRAATWKGLLIFCLHGIVAFVLLYIVNTTDWFAGVHVPTNPLTLAIVGCLGLPGLTSIIFLKMILI